MAQPSPSEHLTEKRSRSFDSLSYAKSMESVGFTRQQAEMMAEKQAELIDDRLATKADLEAVRLTLAADIERPSITTKADLQATEPRLKLHIGGMIFALGGILIAVKYFG